MHNLARCALLAALVGCRSTNGPLPAESADHAALHATLGELYRAFAFEPDAEPDWRTQRRLYLEGATFVAPVRPDRTPVGVDTETFVDDFRTFARTGEHAHTGLHERILRAEIAICGHIAHTFVLFEGHLPDRAEAETRGLDSIQWVRAGDDWRLVSFTTQYESPGAPLDLRRRTFP